MAKVNNQIRKNPWSGEVIYFATLHEKEKIVAPVLNEVDLECRALQVDTDLLGTFSGEIKRKKPVKETLREKIKMGLSLAPEGRFFLASEGSFTSHPQLGFLPTDLESLLLFDQKNKIEIYAEFLSTEVIHDEIKMEPKDSIEDFLKRNQFPSHSLVVKPVEFDYPIFKGLNDRPSLDQALLNCFNSSPSGKIILQTDLRAHHNPTRQKAIRKAAENLLEKLKSLCPECKCPGFDIKATLPGLCCIDCGYESTYAKKVIWKCDLCLYEKTTDRPDGIKALQPEECQLCNP